MQEAQAGSSLTESRGASGPGCHSSTAPSPTPPPPNPPGPHVQSALGTWGSVPQTFPLLVLLPSPCPGIAEFSQLLGQASSCRVPSLHMRTPAPFQAPGPEQSHKSARRTPAKSGPFNATRHRLKPQCGRARGTIPPQAPASRMRPVVPGGSWPSPPPRALVLRQARPLGDLWTRQGSNPGTGLGLNSSVS